MKKLTIITICFNEENTIKRTIESVLTQTYSNFEYIIKDGNSSDKTNEIVKSYREKFENRDIRFVHLVGSDEGIYDAMRIALEESSGEWVNFMNAGDSFYNELVCEEVFQYRTWMQQGVLYGHTLCELERSYKFVQINNHHNLINGTGICQQACFVRKKVLDDIPFSKNYKILGDYDFLLRALDANIMFKQLNLIVVNYNRRGVSSRQIYKTHLEKNDIMRRYNKDIKIGIRKKIELKFKTCIGGSFPMLLDFLFCKRLSKSM